MLATSNIKGANKKCLPFALITLILIITWAPRTQAGHIYSYDLDFEYQSAGHATDFRLFFSLESGISDSDYLNVVFPFTLGHPSINPPSGSLFQVSSALQLGKTQWATGSTDANYFFNFGVPLLPNEWYYLKLKANSTIIVGAQVPGRQRSVEFYTASGIFGNRIIYDLNPNFASFSLADVPKSTLRAIVAYMEPLSRYNIETNYEVVFDVIPTVAISGGAYFDFILVNNAYIFTSSCRNAEVKCAATDVYCENIVLLGNSKCSIDPNNPQRVRFLYDQDVVPGKKFRVSMNVKNPSFVTDPTDVIVLSVSKKSNVIFEKTLAKTVLEVNLVSMSVSLIKYLWGITEKAELPCPIRAYTSKDDAAIAEIVYNNIRVYFKFRGRTSNIYSHSVYLYLGKSQVAAILGGSIIYNLPNFKNFPVSCSVDGTGDYLVCNNVGLMAESADYNYFIGFRALIDQQLLQQFGVISIYTVDDSGVLNRLSNENIGEKTPLIWNGKSDFHNTNTDQFHSSTNNAFLKDNIIVSLPDSTIVDGPMLTSILSGTGSASITLNPQVPQQLLFLIQLSISNPSELCNNNGVASSCNGGGAGQKNHVLLKIVFNNANLGIPDSDFSKGLKIYKGWFGESCTSPWSKCMDYNNVDSGAVRNSILSVSATGDDASYEHLSLTCIAGAIDPEDCHIVTPRSADGITFSLLSMRNIKFSSGFLGVSPYPDQTLIDFIVCVKNSNTVPAPTTDNLFGPTITSKLINTYVMNSVPLNLNAAFMNIGYGAKHQRSPTLLRLTGFLGSTELSTSANALSIFLDNQFDLVKASDNNNLVGCVGSTTSICRAWRQIVNIGGYDTSEKISHFTYSQNRIDIPDTFSPGKQIEMYVAVYLKAAPVSVEITLQTNYADNRFYTPLANFRFYGAAYGGSRAITLKYDVVANINNNMNDAEQYNSASPSCTSSQLGVYEPESIFFPGNQIGLLKIRTSVASQVCLGSTSGILNNDGVASGKFGGGFVITSTENIWGSGDITWTLSKTALNNKCQRIKYYADSYVRYSIICPSDKTSDLTLEKPGDASQVVSIAQFSIPFYWGMGYPFNQKIVYSWSRYDGRVATYNQERGKVTKNGQCVNGVWPTIYTGLAYQNLTLFVRISSTLTVTPTDTLILYDYYDITPTDMLIITSENCIVGAPTSKLNISSCTVSDFGSNPNRITFTITVASESQLTGDIYLSFMTNHQSNVRTSQYQHGFQVVLNSYAVEDCWTNLTARGVIPRSLENIVSPVLNLSDPVYIPTKTSLSPISIRFAVNSKRPIWRSSSFLFDLGFLTTPNDNNLASNDFRCYVLNSLGFLSFEWESIEVSSLSKINLLPKRAINNVQEYTLQCLGGRALDGISKANISAVFRSGLSILQTSRNIPFSVDRSSASNIIPSEKVFLEVKTLNSPGFDSNYIISFKLHYNDYPETGRILIGFHKKIAPRLNHLGERECFLDGGPVFCNIISERLLSIRLNKRLDSNLTTFFKLEIKRVRQPHQISSSDKIWFAVDNDDNIYNGIGEQADIGEKALLSPQVNNFMINDISVSSVRARDRFNVSINLTLPAKTMVEDNVIYVRFPQVYNNMFKFQSGSPTCTIWKGSPPNLVKNCSFVDQTRVKIFVSASAENANAAANYVLNFNDLNTPDVPTLTDSPNFFQIYTTKGANQDEIVSISEYGYIDKFSLSFTFDDKKANPVWFKRNPDDTYTEVGQKMVNINSGTYSTQLYLGFQNLNDTYNISWPFSATNTNVSDVSIWPRTPTGEVGFRFVKVYLAAGLKQLFGDYFIEFRRNTSSALAMAWISEVPSVNVNITTSKCKIEARQSNYDLPIGGRSLPIIFDYKDCMPLSSISLTADVGQNGGGMTFLGGSSNLTKQISFNSDNIEANSRVLFIALGKNLTAGVGNLLQVTFLITGPNALSYLAPEPVFLRVVDPYFFSNTTNGTIPVVTINLVTRQANYKFSCTQPSLIYYIYSLDKLVLTSTQADEIKNKTLEINLERTTADKLDISWTVMGFAVQETKEQVASLQVDGLKAGGQYNLRYYCGDLLGNFSQPSDTNFTMPDNGARYSVATLTFKGPLVTSQNLQIVCSLLKIFAVKRERIVTEYGGYCPLVSIPIERSFDGNDTYDYRFYFLPDYQLRNDTLWITGSNYFYNKDDITKKIIDNTDAGASGFPTLRNVSFTPLGGKSSSGITPRIASNISLFNLTSSGVMMSFTLYDTDGYLLVGIGYQQNIRPTIYQLKNGLDANNVALRTFNYGFVKRNNTVTVNISGLVDATNYAAFYGAINDEPSIEALGSDVVQVNFTTRLAATKWAERVKVTALALLAILYILFN